MLPDRDDILDGLDDLLDELLGGAY